MADAANDLRFDDRVAIVTGAGGNPGLGRAYALLLAARGARIVVNDFGVGPDGRGILRPRAEAVVQEIVGQGGEAVADTNSVAELAGAEAIAQTALEHWGRIDILVNNAGVFHLALFDEIATSDIEQIVRTHLLGHMWMCRAMWPHMKRAGYGRIVNVSSGALLGGRYNVPYGAAKAGVWGLTRGLAVEGEPDGIKVNALGPGAHTIASDHLFHRQEFPGIDAKDMIAEHVAPTVAFLAHESCPFTGKFISSMAKHVAEWYLGHTRGTFASTPEEVRDNIDAIVDRGTGEAFSDPTIGEAPAILEPKPYTPPEPTP